MPVSKIIVPEAIGKTPMPFVITPVFSGVSYRMRFTWNNRTNEDTGAWYHDLRTANGTAVLIGMKLTLTDDAWRLFHYIANVPPGAFRVRRLDKLTNDPGLYELAGPVVMEYVT
jgi:hypothetical protein